METKTETKVKTKTCPTCKGAGEVEVKRERHIESVKTCPTCGGSGEIKAR